MASAARLVLEDMVPELQDLEEKGYFEEHEIRQVIQKRQEFELKIRRKAAVKNDFLRYIEFECDLERMRQLRQKVRNIKGMNDKSEHSIVRRTHMVYEKMLRKFKGDIELWSQWLSYCQRTGSSRQMSKVLTRSLQLHPTQAALWAYAAAWEFENNNNATAARALMQTGLRMAKDSPQLWHEYFRLEILYANRLWARRQVLGLKLPTETAPEDDVTAKAAEEVMRGGVARIVYRNAIAAVVDSAAFRMKFLDIVKPVELPGREEVHAFITEDIIAAFPDSTEAWQLRVETSRAAVEEDGGGDVVASFEAALNTFVEGLDSSSSTSMPSSEGLQAAFQQFIEHEIQSMLSNGQIAEAEPAINKLLNSLAELTSPSASLLLLRSRVHARTGDVSGAFSDAVKACTSDPNCGEGLRTAASITAAASNNNQLQKQQYTQGVSSLIAQHPSMGGSLPEVWLCVLRLFVAQNLPLDALAHTFRRCYVEQSIGTMDSHQWALVAERFVHAAYALGGMGRAKEMFVLMQGTQIDRQAVEHFLK